MTIITTFITPYMVKIGWKIADTLGISNNNVNNNNKKTLRRLGLFKFFKRERQQKEEK